MRRLWIAVLQDRDTKQFDASSMHVIDCWVSEGDRDDATAEANKRLAGWRGLYTGPCKISLFEGDLTAQIFHGQV